MTGTDTLFTPGTVVADCPIVSVIGARYILRCACDCTFAMTRTKLAAYAESNERLTCPDCQPVRSRSQQWPLVGTILQVLANAKRPLTEWDLTVLAWQAAPQRLGLRNYETQHPDHKRVTCELVKLVRRGEIVRPMPNVYAMTPIGHAYLEQLRRLWAKKEKKPA